MKSYVLRCNRCGAAKEFRGDDANAIIAAIDASGWVDRPREDKLTHCPKCEAQYQEELR